MQRLGAIAREQMVETRFSVTAVFAMAGRPIHEQSREALQVCMTAALDLVGTGIHLTLRAAHRDGSLRYFFRLSARFSANEVATINVHIDEWWQAKIYAPRIVIPRTPTDHLQGGKRTSISSQQCLLWNQPRHVLPQHIRPCGG